MRYDELERIYPQIEELFALVAKRVHTGKNTDDISSYISMCEEIRPMHRQAVIDKLAIFANVVEANNEYLTYGDNYDGELLVVQSTSQPEACPFCHSIETNYGICSWCHNELAG